MERAMQQGGGQEAGKVTLLQTIWSVLASFFGVQSTRNWHRDFTRGDPWAFVVVGVAITAVFIFVLLGIVRLMLHLAGM
jgi:hypothetical protein